MSTPFPILYEDNHLLVVNKPAMLPTMGVEEGKASLLQEAKQYIGRKYGKPGNVYLGVVSRLDAPVTGVLVIARTSKAASRLTEAFREGRVDKKYWAVVDGEPPDQGICEDWLKKDERHRKVHVTRIESPDAKQARLTYRVVARLAGSRTLLAVTLDTGRKHQIRVQLASRKWPIVGDRKYGSASALSSGIALHAVSLGLEHPVRREPLRFIVEPPPSWVPFQIGVTAADWAAESGE